MVSHFGLLICLVASVPVIFADFRPEESNCDGAMDYGGSYASAAGGGVQHFNSACNFPSPVAASAASSVLDSGGVACHSTSGAMSSLGLSAGGGYSSHGSYAELACSPLSYGSHRYHCAPSASSSSLASSGGRVLPPSTSSAASLYGSFPPLGPCSSPASRSATSSAAAFSANGLHFQGFRLFHSFHLIYFIEFNKNRIKIKF